MRRNRSNESVGISKDLQVDYCSVDKTLYQVYYATEDAEED